MRESTRPVEVTTLVPGDKSLLENVASDVFDDDIHPCRVREFLAD